MIRVFCGYDDREAVGFHVFIQSLLKHVSRPVCIIPLTGQQRDGTNTFTYSRFLVPHLCNFTGSAIYLDGSDMLMRADIAELSFLADSRCAVQVVRHHYWTAHPKKYLGTSMEADNLDYPRKNWSSVMIWNCGHPANRVLTPEFVEKTDGSYLHRFAWLGTTGAEIGNLIGQLPMAWNVLIGEQREHPEPKVAHFTLGIPGIPAYAHGPYTDEWHDTVRAAMRVP